MVGLGQGKVPNLWSAQGRRRVASWAPHQLRAPLGALTASSPRAASCCAACWPPDSSPSRGAGGPPGSCFCQMPLYDGTTCPHEARVRLPPSPLRASHPLQCCFEWSPRRICIISVSLPRGDSGQWGKSSRCEQAREPQVYTTFTVCHSPGKGLKVRVQRISIFPGGCNTEGRMPRLDIQS